MATKTSLLGTAAPEITQPVVPEKPPITPKDILEQPTKPTALVETPVIEIAAPQVSDVETVVETQPLTATPEAAVTETVVVDTPASDVTPEAPAVPLEDVVVDAPKIKPQPTLTSFRCKIPSSWIITATGEDTISAFCASTNEWFEGEIADFNKALRG
jgi:hypothetical protein